MTDPHATPQAPARGEGDTLYRFAGIVTAFTLLSRILGMVRDLVISHRFGASAATDAWVQAFRIPNALRRLTAEGSMTIAFVPVYVELREREGRAGAQRFAARVLGLVLGSTALLTVLGVGFSRALTGLFSPGYAHDPAQFDLAAAFLRWTFPYLALVSVVAWAMGVLNSEHRFAAPAAAPVLLNLGIIGAVLGFSGAFDPPAFSIAAGILVGGVAQVALQVPSLLRAGIPLVPLAGWGRPEMRRFFALMGPALFGVAVYQINIIVLGILASYLPTGQVFHYNNATRLTELVMGLFTFAFTTAGLPTLSRHQARGDWERMGETIRFTFAAVLFVTLPAMAGLFVVADGVVAMLYLHGAFTAADVRSTADTLRYMALGMPAVALVRVMVPVFYALRDSRTPVGVAALSVLVTGLLGWWLSRSMQVAGLALGLSLGAWFQALGLALRLRGRAPQLGRWFPWRSVAVQAGAAALMGALAAWAGGWGEWALGPASLYNWAVLVATLGGAVALYAALTLALREEQAAHWYRLAGRLGRRLTRPPAGGPPQP
jgi:putative peptidoglycan lipid II flippase